MLAAGLGSLYAYRNNLTTFTWPVSYLETNTQLAESLQKTYTKENSVYAQGIDDSGQLSVRGYTNVLFQRGVYEWKSLDQMIDIAAEKEKRYVVYLYGVSQKWSQIKYTGYKIYDTVLDETVTYYLAD